MFLTYDQAKGYSEEQLRSMGLYPAGNGNWMDASTAIGLGYPATAFGTGGILQFGGYDINSLNHLISNQATANFNTDMAVKNTKVTPDAAAALAGPAYGGTTGLGEVGYLDGSGKVHEVDASGNIVTPGIIDQGIDWIGDKASDLGGWLKDNAWTFGLGGVGALLAGPAGAVTGAKVGDKIDTYKEDKQNKIDNIDNELTNYFGEIDKTESDIKIDNILQDVVNNPVDPLTAFNQPDIGGGISNSLNNPSMPSNTPVSTVTTGLNIPVEGYKPEDTIAPNIGGGTVNNMMDEKFTMPQTNIFQNSSGTVIPNSNNPAVSLTNNVPLIEETKNNLENNYGLVNIPKIETSTPIIETQPTVTEPTITEPTITEPTTAVNPGVQNTGINAGSLPQFRKELNSALANAKRLSIQRARPLSENDISGVVEGLASGATGRLRDAEQMQLAREGLALDRERFEADKASDAERIQILKDQMATAKDQWERGFLSDTEYRDKVLELQLEWAEKGYNLDLDYTKEAEKNADTGNILGAINLISELF